MTDISITSELLATPRLLVVRNNSLSVVNYIEILLLEVSPSGLYIKYKPIDSCNNIWTNVDTFKLIEVLDKK
jgi:hypothetical protein